MTLYMPNVGGELAHEINCPDFPTEEFPEAVDSQADGPAIGMTLATKSTPTSTLGKLSFDLLTNNLSVQCIDTSLPKLLTPSHRLLKITLNGME